ncbi:hypothetical protein [Butyrivibrio sp. INlla16]|uniref:hypothetical protein n=1 Tax=Butyrivibrio sp. INlla16 TaxID=1520807 RepID=UPI0011133F91|nr:hypothetical protein [Butyrivibrio sp. INlla16]
MRGLMTLLNDSKKTWDKAEIICGSLLYLISSAMIIFSAYLCFSPDIWYDELFSMQLATKPVSEMVKLTAADVHPPLYYIIVHFVIKALTPFGNSFMSSGLVNSGAALGSMQIMYAKLASVIPLFILFLYAVTIIRKRYGILVGGLFSCAVIAMPQMADYAVEVRMYSWVMLFVTALCIHAGPFIETEKDKQIKGLKWGKIFPLFIYGLLACYTQYYAAVAVAAVYLFLIIWSVRKNVYQLGILLISANMTAVCYVPWISVVLSQARSVSSNYWIQPLSLRSFGGIIKFLMKPGFFNDKLATVLAVVMFVLVVAVVFCNIRDSYMWLCFMPIIGIIAFGFAVSFLLRPVFIYRYMIPAMGAMWLSVLIAAKRLLNGERGKLLFAGLLLYTLMTIFCIRDFWAFRGNELYKRVNMVQTEQFWKGICEGTGAENTDEDSLSEDPILICNFEQVAALSMYYANGYCDIVGDAGKELPVQVYLYGAITDSILESTLPGIQVISEYPEVQELVDSGRRVLFLGSFNSREDILQEWKDSPAGIENKNIGSYLNERYWFDVFELSRK